MRPRVTALLAALAIGVLLPLALPAAPAHAEGRLELDPARGAAGSSLTVRFFDYGIICWIQVKWDSQSGPELANVPPWTKSTTITIPSDAAPGAHVIHTTQCLGKLQANFEVTRAPGPPSPPPAPSPRPPATPGPGAPPASGAPHPSVPPGSPSSPPSSSPGASPAPGTRPLPPTGDVFAPAPVVQRRGGRLMLDRDFIRPGERVIAQGSGCAPGESVALTSDGEALATATADRAGTFSVRTRLAQVAPGRRVITARCKILLSADVDIVVPTASSGLLGVALPLFLLTLLGAIAVGWQYAVLWRPRPARSI